MTIKVNNPTTTETEEMNFGVWLKGNDTDGWTPYI